MLFGSCDLLLFARRVSAMTMPTEGFVGSQWFALGRYGALLSTYQIMMGEDWHLIMLKLMSCKGNVEGASFALLVIVLGMLLVRRRTCDSPAVDVCCATRAAHMRSTEHFGALFVR